tara:strand:+ start:1419 stop:1817 length:399 start_codon:yes stop_codon:yes gene_type:complete
MTSTTKNKDYPDSVVYTDGEFDAKTKQYPTNLGAPSFEPLSVDKSEKHKANNYFESRLNELKEEYKQLVMEYNWTKLVYESEYSFQPLIGVSYHLYERKDKNLFLSLISPQEWDQPYVGTFKLLNNGKWEKL